MSNVFYEKILNSNLTAIAPYSVKFKLWPLFIACREYKINTWNNMFLSGLMETNGLVYQLVKWNIIDERSGLSLLSTSHDIVK